MALRQYNIQAEFQHDGTFADEPLEAEFRAHTWKRDCQQLHAIAMPVAVVMLALIPLDGPALGWNSSLFYGEIVLRSFAAIMCVLTYLAYKHPPETPGSLALPFVTTLAANTVILYAIASGANGMVTGTPITIAATLVFWAFAPLKARHLLIAGGSLCLGYIVLLLLWFPVDYQSIVIAPTLLVMINTLGFLLVRNRNISERKEMIIARELLTTTKTLRQEIATRLEAEKHAGANEEIFHGVFASCPVPLCMIDPVSKRFIRANNRMEAFLGYSEKELLDKPIRELFADNDALDEAVVILQRDQSVLYGEIRMLTRDGDIRWTLLSARRFSMPDGETVLANFIDISDQKQRETDLAIASEDAEKANIAKSQFLANMSHELRTPLNAIIGFSDIMESEVFGAIGNERYLGYMTDIKSSGVHLLSIINEILDMSKIESNTEGLHQEEVDLNEVVEMATRLIHHHAEKKSIQLDMALASDELVLMGDERAIKQIILNLLSNAIKFTPDDGSILVRTHQIGSRVVIEISDTGLGIPEDQLDSITEPFVQLESSLSSTKTGTGLGLSIATRLAELHGGRLEFESVVNAGTTARLILPHIRDDKLAL